MIETEKRLTKEAYFKRIVDMVNANGDEVFQAIYDDMLRPLFDELEKKDEEIEQLKERIIRLAE